MNAKRKKRIITIFIILFVLCFGRPYYKPTYSGRVVDFETGEPLPRARIRVDYWAGYYGIIEKNSNLLNNPTYYTDRDGNFSIPPFFALIGIFSWDAGVTFSIKKDNYPSIITKDLTECLSHGCDEDTYIDQLTKRKVSISTNCIKLSKI